MTAEPGTDRRLIWRRRRVDLAGEARRRLEPVNAITAIGKRERQVGPRRRGAEVDGSASDGAGWNASASPSTITAAWSDQIDAGDQRPAGAAGRTLTPVRLSKATNAITANATAIWSAAMAERRPERREVRRHRQRRDGQQDRVVEHDRPAGDEADELVERVAAEHRRSASLLVQRRALRVGHRGELEEDPAGEEHERASARRRGGRRPRARSRPS